MSLVSRNSWKTLFIFSQFQEKLWEREIIKKKKFNSNSIQGFFQLLILLFVTGSCKKIIFILLHKFLNIIPKVVYRINRTRLFEHVESSLSKFVLFHCSPHIPLTVKIFQLKYSMNDISEIIKEFEIVADLMNYDTLTGFLIH
jgi:hypothetical protein